MPRESRKCCFDMFHSVFKGRRECHAALFKARRIVGAASPGIDPDSALDFVFGMTTAFLENPVPNNSE